MCFALLLHWGKEIISDLEFYKVEIIPENYLVII